MKRLDEHSQGLLFYGIHNYEVTKTFAWGGMYGAFTNIKEAEVGFCKAVANSILNKE